MSFDNVFKCKICMGQDKCDKLCDYRLGESIIDYINGVEKVETRIGTYTDYDNKKNGLTYTGVDFPKLADTSRCDILKFSDLVKIEKLNKMNTVENRDIKYYVDEYIKMNNGERRIMEDAHEKLDRFNGYEVMIAPITPGKTIEVHLDGFKDVKLDEGIRVDFVRYKINDETGKVEGSIITDGCGYTNKFFNLKFEDYGKSWTIPEIEKNLTTAQLKYGGVKMTQLGTILPLEITSKTGSVAVDNKYMYYIKNGMAYIIGSWGTSGIITDSKKIKEYRCSKLVKCIESYLKLLERHKKYILPLGTSETNQIECKD